MYIMVIHKENIFFSSFLFFTSSGVRLEYEGSSNTVGVLAKTLKSEPFLFY